MGGFCRWLGKAADADGWLEGGCSAFVAVAKFTPAGRGLCTGVVSCCLQRTTVAGVAWQLPVRCGTASEDGARSIDTVGRLDLQRTAAGCSASLSDSGAVHRRKMVQTTTLVCCHDGGSYVHVLCNELLSADGRGLVV